MPAGQPLTPTAAFWLHAMELFDPSHDGAQWESSLRRLVEPALHDQDQLADLVREGIVIQQFLLELVTRRGLPRDLVANELNTLLASDKPT